MKGKTNLFVLLTIFVVLLVIVFITINKKNKKKEKFIDSCLGARDGVSGCHDCCINYENQYSKCLSGCMNF